MATKVLIAFHSPDFTSYYIVNLDVNQLEMALACHNKRINVDDITPEMEWLDNFLNERKPADCVDALPIYGCSYLIDFGFM